MNRALILNIFAASCFRSLVFTPATASADEPHLGDLKLTGVNFNQRGWMHCEGQTLQINEYQALFSLFGTGYGGDGRNTFKLPDLRKAEAALRKAAGIPEDHRFLRYMVCTTGTYPSRN